MLNYQKINVSFVDFGTSDLTISKQITGGPTNINNSDNYI